MATHYEFGDLKIEWNRQDREYPYRTLIKGAGEVASIRCSHPSLIYNNNGNIITCRECKQQLDPYWSAIHVFRGLAEFFEQLDVRKKTVEEMEAKAVTHKAALAVERAWRRRKMIPTCPHCYQAIAPEDGFGGSSVGKHTETAAQAKPIEMRASLQILE